MEMVNKIFLTGLSIFTAGLLIRTPKDISNNVRMIGFVICFLSAIVWI